MIDSFNISHENLCIFLNMQSSLHGFKKHKPYKIKTLIMEVNGTYWGYTIETVI